MNRLKSLFTIVVSLAILCFFITLSINTASAERENKAVIKIGVVLPLTGDAAVYGKAMKNGIDLALDEINMSSPRISLIYEDDRGNPNDSVYATRRLIDIEKIPAIIGGAMSSTAEAVVPIINEKKVLLLSPTATKPSLTKEGGYFFRLWPSDNYDGKIMAEVAFKDLGFKRVAIFYINVAYGVGITEVFAREFKRLGGAVVASEGYKRGETDFRGTLTKIASEKPDAIYLPGYVTEVTQILKQAQELDIKIKFLGVNSLYDPKLIEIAGNAAEGAVFTYPTFDSKSQDSVIAAFVKNYKTKYGAEPDAFAAQGYDALRVLSTAMLKIDKKKLNGEQIRRALLALGTYRGPGGNIHFDSKGEVEKKLRLLTINNGVFVQYK